MEGLLLIYSWQVRISLRIQAFYSPKYRPRIFDLSFQKGIST